jgi:hypothetical protein
VEWVAAAMMMDVILITEHIWLLRGASFPAPYNSQLVGRLTVTSAMKYVKTRKPDFCSAFESFPRLRFDAVYRLN